MTHSIRLFWGREGRTFSRFRFGGTPQEAQAEVKALCAHYTDTQHRLVSRVEVRTR